MAGLAISMTSFGFSKTFSGLVVRYLRDGGDHRFHKQSPSVWTLPARVGSRCYNWVRDPTPPRIRCSSVYDSPLAGGSLSRPHERFPTLFRNWFWEKYPYLLPCLFSAVFCTLCVILTWLFLKEVRRFAGIPVKESDCPPI